MKVVYSQLKAFAHEKQLKALREGAVEAPVHVRIKPVNACNHNCWFCAYRSNDLELGELMNLRDRISPEKMNEITDDIISMGVKAVTFSGGGEPLLYRQLPQVMKKLAAAGVKIGTLTNGSLLTGEMAEAFAAHGTWVRISLDGWDAESYAKSRRVSLKEFDKVMLHISDFSKRNSQCTLGISFIVTRENAEHIFEMCARAKSMGVESFKITGCVTSNVGTETNKYHEPIRQIVTSQIERCRSLEDDHFKIADHYHALEERFDKSYHRCPIAQLLTVIGADMKVYTCQDKAYTDLGLLGSIEKRSFKEFWFSEENRLKLRSIDPAVHCKHHCVAHQKNILLNEYIDLDPEHEGFV